MYHSFLELGKLPFQKSFFKNASFITKDHPGTLLECSPNGFLAFLRLVGCAYMKKHGSTFRNVTPDSLLRSFNGVHSAEEQHGLWHDCVQQRIWDRISFEDEMIHSLEALRRHWLRTLWVVKMWSQAQSNTMILPPLQGHGWKRQESGRIEIDWDSEENIKKVKDRVQLLLKGCNCKSGCKTMRCGCKKKKMECGSGCRCIGCENDIKAHREGREEEETEMETAEIEEPREETQMETTYTQDSIDEIMETVFGEAGPFADGSESEKSDESDIL